MPKELRPYLPLYGRDFFDDANVQSMDYDCCYVYLRLIWLCWTDYFIRDDAEWAARQFKAIPREDFLSRCWPQLRLLFEVAEDGKLRHSRVEKIRAEQDEFSAKMSKRGAAGAEARWGKGKSQPLPSGPEEAAAPCLSNAQASAKHDPSIDQASPSHGSSNAQAMHKQCLDDAKRWPASASASALAKEDISSDGRFKEFWELYPEPRRGVIALSYGAYESLIKTLARHNDLLDGLKGWLESEQWTRSLREDGGSFIPYADKFIEKQRYLERPPKKQKSSLERAAERAKALDIQK